MYIKSIVPSTRIGITTSAGLARNIHKLLATLRLLRYFVALDCAFILFTTETKTCLILIQLLLMWFSWVTN